MRLLVHFHIYYQKQVPYFLRKLRNINGIDWDLWVTGEEAAMPQIKAFKADAHFLPVEKVGYDVWPFIALLKAVDLSQYTHVLKLHTKNRSPKIIQLNGVLMPGYRWRNLLVDALLMSPGHFSKALAAADQGLACQYVLVKKLSKRAPSDNELLRAEAARIGLEIKGEKFAAGTMFISRIEPFAIFKNAPLDAAHFEGESATHKSGTPAHVYERLISLCVTSAGYQIVPLRTNPVCWAWSKFIRTFVGFIKG